jgi:type IV fimbrial biogenesis protein FimT
MLVSRRRDRARGFTLLELIVTVSVAAVLAAVVAPSFRAFLLNQRVRNASYELMSALALVRSEAITRNADVRMERLPGSSAWSDGWRVVDPSLPAPPAAPALLQQSAFNGLTITDSAGLGSIVYGKDGRTSSASTKFTLAPANTALNVTSRCVSIGLSGVPSITLGSCS